MRGKNKQCGAIEYDGVTLRNWLQKNTSEDTTRKLVEWFARVCIATEPSEFSLLYFLTWLKSGGLYASLVNIKVRLLMYGKRSNIRTLLFVGRSSEFHCHRRNATAVGRHEERAWPRFPRFSCSFCRFSPTCSGVVQLSCVVKKVVRSGSGVVVHYTRGKQQQLVLVGEKKRFPGFDVFVWNFRRSCRVVV